MPFLSLNFLAFFAILFFTYYFILKNKTKAQNWLLLISSYIFYGLAVWKMIPLLLLATFIFYALGIQMGKVSEKKSSLLSALGVVLGIGLLFYFKYLNFFVGSFAILFKAIGLKANWGSFNILVPLGISFFTFRLISYIIEIHRQKIEPAKDFVVFATYIAFFPTIMSGPIDRPTSFIPQLKAKRPFNYELAVDGCRQILWGLFKKMVIADNLAFYVNSIWQDVPNQSSFTLILAAALYSIQLYTDFSGYSDMAIGIGKVLGFRITKNFNYPFFATNIAEYWRRWHISLTSWLTDYVFMPLNITFRNLHKLGSILAIIITFVLIGLWHGANITFALFGLFHGLLYIPLIYSGAFFKKKKVKSSRLGLPTAIDLFKMIGVFLLVTISLIIFRAENLYQLGQYINGLCKLDDFFSIEDTGLRALAPIFFFIVMMFAMEWKGRAKEYPLQHIEEKRSRAVRWIVYSAIIFFIGMFMHTEQSPFIYFKF